MQNKSKHLQTKKNPNNIQTKQMQINVKKTQFCIACALCMRSAAVVLHVSQSNLWRQLEIKFDHCLI